MGGSCCLGRGFVLGGNELNNNLKEERTEEKKRKGPGQCVALKIIKKLQKEKTHLLSAAQIAQVSSSASVSGWADSVDTGSEDSSGSEWTAVVVSVAHESSWTDLVHTWSCAVSGLASAAVVVGRAEESLSAESSEASGDGWSSGAGSVKIVVSWATASLDTDS